ncbi:uncharacterized protein PHALS_02652 [Plasmopara halstedii]|uniref:Uncharacterized protein n=1 Tax=Plasmopara halstedii TaxID=4781 RepID=A0A0P1AXI8_PLAHL|nr:uncharacterized protein PHALS_02652 [Plasmopara halstedii]CEG46238.1 hypothetical protein PHALS_02652 [Plasmopara halstedii]|eukprot:XP_024582607.1 hypothetical protein PHALS_02652 [Plasmopara halstedii]
MKRGVSKDFVKMFAGSSFDGSEATQLLGSPAFVSCTQLLPMTMRTFTDA